MPIVKVTPKSAARARAATDWTAIDAMTDEDIARQVAENPDAAPLDWLDHGRPLTQLEQLRMRLRLSQREFAQTYGLKLGTIRAIEQGRRKPSGVTATLLRVIEREPEAVRRALARP